MMRKKILKNVFLLKMLGMAPAVWVVLAVAVGWGSIAGCFAASPCSSRDLRQWLPDKPDPGYHVLCFDQVELFL